MKSLKDGRKCIIAFLMLSLILPAAVLAQADLESAPSENTVFVDSEGAEVVRSETSTGPEYVAFDRPIELDAHVVSRPGAAGSFRSAARARRGQCPAARIIGKDSENTPGTVFIQPNEEFDCELVYDNTITTGGGPFPTTQVWMNSTIPAGMELLGFIAPVGASCFEDSNRLDCFVSTVAAFDIKTVTLALVAPDPGSFNLGFVISQFEFDPVPSDNAITVPFQTVVAGQITGIKFHDRNGNGVQDEGEEGLEGWEIVLDGSTSQITGQDGTYTFAGVAEGAHSIQEDFSAQPPWQPSTNPSTTVMVEGGQTAVVNFGNYLPATITITKFLDLNGNGERDLEEPALSGWEMSVDGSSQDTDANGLAVFEGLAPGPHDVEESVQPGWEVSTNNNPSVVELTSGEVREVVFGNYEPVTVTVTKFNDLDADGEWDQPDEPPLSDWEFMVGAESQVTDAAGVAVFAGVRPGDIEVTEESRTSWKVSTGENPRTVSAVSGESVEVLFGNYETGDIVVYKYEDRNGNGEKDDGEEFLEDWTVYVNDEAMQTGADGTATYEDRPLGEYEVREEERDGWEVTTGNNPVTVTLESGEDLETESPQEVHFGNRGTGSILVTKFHDRDGDGERDIADEEILAGWDITVRGETKATDANGEALFEGIPPGTYDVSEAVQDGWTPTMPNPSSVTVGPGENVEFHFGNAEPGSIEGYKWQDDNGDGIWDAAEVALPGWTITCSGPSCPAGTTTVTDANGYYKFSDLKPGTYGIGEVQMTGWMMTHPVPGGGSYVFDLESGEQIGLEGEANLGNKPPPPPPDDELDWGDAPEEVDSQHADLFPVGYPTSIGNNGAFHLTNPEVRIGPLVDPELNGQPTLPADGDDTDSGVDDEDGIEFYSDFIMMSLNVPPGAEDETIVAGQVRGESGRIVVTPSTNGILDAWVDWNRDGDWDDAGEKIYDGEAIMAASDTLDWDVPSDADVGYTYARFRFTLTGTESPGGAGSVGEVEDYVLYTLAPEDLTSSDDTGDANPGDGICADTFGACTVRAAIMEANASGLPLFVSAGALAKSGQATLQPQTPYPAITGTLLLNGDGTLEIDGSQAGAGANGFVLEGSGSWIASTDINSFDGDGVRITGSNNVMFDNVIHDNGGAGVNVVSGTGNVIFSSAIFANGGLGIDLGDDGVTMNDTDDSDDGPNGLQNYPNLSLAMADESRIEGSLNTTPNGLFAIDFYASAACDPSSSGEGARYLGSREVETDNLGMASFNVVVNESGFAAGESVTATATNLTAGDANRGSTSEFSSCETATATAIERNPDAELPVGHQLFQNYPNPFNPTTHIRFAITQREWVRIEVYDILGKRVATLVDGYVDAGEFTVEFDGGDLPSGIYLYRMSAGSYAAAKQLTLLK